MTNTRNTAPIKTQIEDVYNQICKSFSVLDLDSVLTYFSDRDDMVKISNGTLLRGKKELYEYWHKRLGGAADLRITIENVEIHEIGNDHVWTTADEYIVLGDHSQRAIVSNIFILTPDGWKILLDHTTYVE